MHTDPAIVTVRIFLSGHVLHTVVTVSERGVYARGLIFDPEIMWHGPHGVTVMSQQGASIILVGIMPLGFAINTITPAMHATIFGATPVKHPFEVASGGEVNFGAILVWAACKDVVKISNNENEYFIKNLLF